MPTIEKAVENTIKNFVYGFLPSTELDNPISPAIDMVGGDTFRVLLFEDGADGSFEAAKDSIPVIEQELIEGMRSRNLTIEILSTRVVQQFTWCGKEYDMADHEVNWAYIVYAEVTERHGTIFRNSEDVYEQEFAAKMDQLKRGVDLAYRLELQATC